ncbi:hypothetical protein RclHR1_09450006 [Rhizophagus clarus]|uniref:Uncharacterized protein n=1 Tax=Rhizophagus clarus TaxID=94130 RepID=A0A2Z6SII9_9GLOM|nr:hypothetical protein RclHR1_09450006 [Rhizophagus clarus]
MRPPTAESEIIDINMENANNNLTIPPQPSGSDNITPKNMKIKKAVDKSVEKIYVNTTIPDDKQANIRDIFIYNVPSSWSYEKILAELKAWRDPISMIVKKQRKYQTLQIKICLSTFTLTSFKQEIWQYSLGDISVQSRFWVTWERTTPSQLIFEIYRRTRFTFSHNDVDYFLPWCSAPFTASQTQTKKSKDSSDSSKKTKTNDSSKKTKNSSSFKTHSANSKCNKDKTKTSKKSKDKKKKKSSGKKSDDKIDIVKLLLTLISKF